MFSLLPGDVQRLPSHATAKSTEYSITTWRCFSDHQIEDQTKLREVSLTGLWDLDGVVEKWVTETATNRWRRFYIALGGSLPLTQTRKRPQISI
jgi:hypothetical protein